MHVKTVALFLVATFVAAFAASAAERKSCAGDNLLDKLASTDPATHARIIAKSDALENGKAVFWKLERKGTAPSYLFGTVHLSDRRVTRLSNAAKQAIRNSKALLIENANLSADAATSAFASAIKSAVFTDGQSLDKLLTAEEFAAVLKHAYGGGMPAEMMRLYRPWMVSLMLSASDCERSRLAKGYRVLDLVIADRARVNGIPVSGLETTVDQLNALASVPDDDAVKILRANIALVGEGDHLRETMVQLYLARRIGALWELQLALSEQAGVPANAYTSFEQAIIIERNKKMRDGALPYLEKGGAFIAVGTLHLPGKAGLVELFKEAGYTLSPIE